MLGNTKTALTGVAMEEIFAASNSTYTTAVTMKYLLLFPFIIKEIANCTKIPGKFDTTLQAVFGRCLNIATV